jgi:alpha-amylase/alpha-mannosidase (GH57 family)
MPRGDIPKNPGFTTGFRCRSTFSAEDYYCAGTTHTVSGGYGMGQFICIHGHFYQPPRENPWIEEVEVEDSAYPYHDWNARITAECYAPNAASRILDSQKNIIDIVNNYASISFNFGPTLLMWLEQNNPVVYSAILKADKNSMKRFSGHGSAIAQVYNHLIMPLATRRDKRTQVLWGISDFRHRFGRFPEGMWLAETAVDTETLEILADQGILFTILSPSQALRVKRISGGSWTTAIPETLDCSVAYRCQLRNNRSIVIFFYDKPVSEELAFGSLLENGEAFAHRMIGHFARPGRESGLLSIVSDGETYGHHHRFADMALAYALYDIERDKSATITIFGEYLAGHPPAYDVEIRENTSWSCPHGVERWRANCGCCTKGTAVHDAEKHSRRITETRGGGSNPPQTCDLPGNQNWRAPLREAMDHLRGELDRIFETSAAQFLADPWSARDDYITVILDRSPVSRENFLNRHASRKLTYDEQCTAFTLLEMERNALLMFTSCGWFFDDISGIESVQVMKYACRAMQLAKDVTGNNLEPDYLNALSRARSNKPGHLDGSTIYLDFVRPSVIDLNRIVFNHALTRLVSESADPGTRRYYTITDESHEKMESGEFRAVAGVLSIRSEISCRQKRLIYAVLHLGNYDFMGGVKEYDGEESFHRMQEQLRGVMQKGSSSDLIHVMEHEFGTSTYSLWHLVKDARQNILSLLLRSTLAEVETSLRRIYRQNMTLIHAMKEMRVPIPRIFEEPVEYILNSDLNNFLGKESVDLQKTRRLVSEMTRGQFTPDRETLGFTASKLITLLTRRLSADPKDIQAMQEIIDLFLVLAPLTLEYDLWESQNEYYYTGKKQAAFMQQKALMGDEQAARWILAFRQLGTCLGVRSID